MPTSVGVRYGRSRFSIEAFLGGLGTNDFRVLAHPRPTTHPQRDRDLPRSRACAWAPSLSSCWDHLPYRVPPSLCNEPLRCRNLSPACHRLRLLCPRLRTRLTLGRLTVPRNPQAFGVSGSHRHCATHSGILTCARSTSSHDLASRQEHNAPLPSWLFTMIHGFGTMLEPRYVVGAPALDQ